MNRAGTPIRNFRINPFAIALNNMQSPSISTNTLNTWFALAKAAGIRRIRAEFSMADIQATQGVFTYGGFNNYDRFVYLAQSYGIEIIAICLQYSMPSWASPSGSMFAPSPSVYQAWCQNMAAHYAGVISLFEMGNEPNYNFSWPYYPSTQNATQAAAAYTALLKAGYAGIKAGNPNAKVISAGLGSIGTTDSNGIKTEDYMTTMYANGCKGYYDYFGLHPYAQPDNDAVFSHMTNNLDSWRGIMLANNDTVPVAITELGWTTYTGGVSQTAQAANIVSLYNAMMFGNYKYVDIFVNYDFINGSTDLTNHQDNYGIVNSDLSPKPSYQSFVTAANTFINSFIEIPTLV